jgi:hypothetical protein
MVSQWEQPTKSDENGKENVVLNGLKVNEQMIQFMSQHQHAQPQPSTSSTHFTPSDYREQLTTSAISRTPSATSSTCKGKLSQEQLVQLAPQYTQSAIECITQGQYK